MYLDQIGSYWDTRAEGYSATIHEQLENGEAVYFRELLREGAPAGDVLRCLDIGCGPGFFSILLARDGHSVTAVDYSEGMLAEAQRNFTEAGVSVELLRGDAQSLPFPDGSFDYIVSRNLVWDLEDPERAYREWLRLLKPGGRLCIVDGNHYLYYFDSDYLKAEDSYRGLHHHECYGVDPTPINEIARQLPLSHEYRPAWDIAKLLELGLERAEFRVSRRAFSENGADKSVISDFVIYAEKPSPLPVLTEAEQQQAIDDEWTGAADNYDSIIHDELASFRADAWTKRILRYAPQKDCLDVLDAGCGPGFFSILLSKAGCRAVGVDGSVGMLRHASENAAQEGVFPVFIKGDCHALPFADNSFDLVVSRNLTHALRDHRKVYAEWRRVLRPGGRVLIFDANWHLMQTDPVVRRAFAAREEECFAIYGSTFSGKATREVEDREITCPHRLGTVQRPTWDLPLLEAAGFRNVFYEENISDSLWDDKEKLLYGETPMFMISAEK